MTQPNTSAAKQYADEVQLHVPGLAVSAIPRLFQVPCTPKGTQVVDLGNLWRMPERWPNARAILAKLVDPFHYGPGMRAKVPKGWTFATVAERLVPERFDLPNPRWYTLSGEHLPWDHLPGQVGKALAASFEAMLVDVWHSSPANTKGAEVVACLEHHRRKGGNAQALTFHVEGLVDRWRRTPPTRPDAVRLARVEVAGASQLTKALEAWLATASKAPATSATPVAKSIPRPELRLLALVHALRWLTGDKAADITAANADALAKDAGSNAKSAGRELRKAYTRYHMQTNSKAERLQDGKAYTVKARYQRAVQMLEAYPEAKAMAERELEEIRERE